MRRAARALACCLGLAGAPISAQTGMTWQVYHGSAAPGYSGVELFYGVPRSGDLLISASCEISGPAPIIRLTLYSGDLPAPRGAQVTVSVQGTSAAAAFQARNDGYDDFMGLTLLEARLPVDHPVWQAFASPGPLSYSAAGTPAITIAGDQLPVEDFVALCTHRGGPSCSAMAVSAEGGPALTLQVTNSARAARRILWIDPDGAMAEIGRLEPGQSGTLDTEWGHVWLFADDQGRCVELRQSGLARSGIELFQPGPD